ncbi:MAG: hypothetical protein JNJ54_30105 [Myxococcaceae bacterium]|nr:hypothetical protein [Myxococcaceae bacterium]
MDELKPWSASTDPAEVKAARLVALAAQVPPAPLDHTSWDRVVRGADGARDVVLLPAFAAALVAGVLLVLWLRPAPVSPAGPEAPVLVASANSSFAQQPSGVVRLDAGRLAVQRATAAKVVFITPHVTLEASRSRFLAEVTAGGTTVRVEEGEVVLRAKDTTRVVKAGETLVWPPSPNIPLPLTTVASTTPVCDATAGERLDCLRAEAKGDGLLAQAALYELGVLEAKQGNRTDALAAWTTSLSRFPDGVLHPEVRLALLVELTRARRFTEAVAVARAFEERCAQDPRLADVVALRRSLER